MKSRTLNEEQIIRILWRYLSSTLPKKEKMLSSEVDPFSDDASWFTIRSGKRIVFFKTDMLVSSTDVPPDMSPSQIAAKAVTGCVSDFAAKGIQPSYGLLSIAVPRKFASLEYVRELGRGFRDSARRYGLQLIGGDTNESKDGGLIIDVSVCGFGNTIVKRSGAIAGDLIGVSGNFGLQPIGLSVLLGEKKCDNVRTQVRAVDTVLNPRARLSLGLASSKFLSSSIDSSDGLALSLYHLAEASRVDLYLDRLPIADGTEEFAKESKMSANDLVLYGGEEYELICTFEKRNESKLMVKGIKTIGEVRPLEKGKRPSVYLYGKKIERKGWLHLQRRSLKPRLRTLTS